MQQNLGNPTADHALYALALDWLVLYKRSNVCWIKARICYVFDALPHAVSVMQQSML